MNGGPEFSFNSFIESILNGEPEVKEDEALVSKNNTP